MKKFNQKATKEFKQFRSDLRENYSWLENFCREKYGKKGNYLDLLSKDIDLLSGNEKEIIELISLDYIKSHSYNFDVRPTLKEATNLLRKKFLDESVESNYKKSINRALLEVLQQIRDNLTHYGKFEIESQQYERNFHIVQNGAMILKRIVSNLDE